MMIERHYDDESLIALSESDRISSDAHLPACTGCSEKLKSFRMVAGALRERGVWDSESLNDAPVPSTIANLRAFADRMVDDDARAERWLTELLAGPRESWKSKLAQHPEYRTAGMVRKLIAASDHAIDTMPPDAVEITTLAADIADHLDPAEHPSDTVSRLRGAAWREKAFALFYTGQNAEAARAAENADELFGACAVDQYDRARVGIIRSLIEKNLDRNDAALAVARESSSVFREHADEERHASARSCEAGALAQAGRYHEALRIWLDLEMSFRGKDSSDGHARALANVAYAYRHLGKSEEAIRYFQMAAAVFESVGTTSEAARIRWNVASLLAENGRWNEAADRLAATRVELRRLGMFGPAAVASLDLAEIRILQSRQSDVPALCSEAIEYFNAAGVAYTGRALRAVAYMHEAAAGGRATPELARSVREYVRRLPAEPALLFLPPDDFRG